MTDDLIQRSKLVAVILSETGIAVRSPDEGDLDDLQKQHWYMCLRIVRMLRAQDDLAGASNGCGDRSATKTEKSPFLSTKGIPRDR